MAARSEGQTRKKKEAVALGLKVATGARVRQDRFWGLGKPGRPEPAQPFRPADSARSGEPASSSRDCCQAGGRSMQTETSWHLPAASGDRSARPSGSARPSFGVFLLPSVAMFLRLVSCCLSLTLALASRGAPLEASPEATADERPAVASPSDRPTAESAGPERAGRPSWTADQVAQWAAREAATARLLDTEWRAVGSQFDRDEASQCWQARLLQSIIRPLAAHERNGAAAKALRNYVRIVGSRQQQAVGQTALVQLSELIQLAQRAAELGLPDGDANALQQQRLQLRQADVEATYGIKQLREGLAGLVGQPRDVAARAQLVTPLELPEPPPAAEEAVAVALADRADLEAVEALCRQLNSATLPVARQALA